MRSLSFRRSVATLVGSFMLSVTLAACGGGASGPSAIPNNNTQPLSQNQGAAQVAATTASSSAALKNIVGTPKYHLYLTKTLNGGKTPSTTRTPNSVIYPADLQYFGGKLLRTARVYNAFVDSKASTYGTPNSFEEHLSYSKMIHITDQYVHTTAGNRYDWAGDLTVNFPLLTIIGDNDLATIVHTAAAAKGAGINHIFNIFLPPGAVYCGSGVLIPSGLCNANANSPNPAFCGFHEAVSFSDIGEVLFTFEPFADLTFCDVNAVLGNPKGPTPNGIQNDSNYSVLSHELFETITDPEPNSGWFAANVGIQDEIGDICAYLPEDTNLSGRLYRIQTEYLNTKHACDNTI